MQNETLKSVTRSDHNYLLFYSVSGSGLWIKQTNKRTNNDDDDDDDDNINNDAKNLFKTNKQASKQKIWYVL